MTTMKITGYNTTEYARTNRAKNGEKYKNYQKNYHRKKYNEDSQYRITILRNLRTKYYYSTDPLPCIRKLWT